MDKQEKAAVAAKGESTGEGGHRPTILSWREIVWPVTLLMPRIASFLMQALHRLNSVEPATSGLNILPTPSGRRLLIQGIRI